MKKNVDAHAHSEPNVSGDLAHRLRPFLVLLHEKPEHKHRTRFRCVAEEEDHARKLALQIYPECVVNHVAQDWSLNLYYSKIQPDFPGGHRGDIVFHRWKTAAEFAKSLRDVLSMIIHHDMMADFSDNAFADTTEIRVHQEVINEAIQTFSDEDAIGRFVSWWPSLEGYEIGVFVYDYNDHKLFRYASIVYSHCFSPYYVDKVTSMLQVAMAREIELEGDVVPATHLPVARKRARR
ncbi:MAG: hypothetical protein ACYDHY_13135 [Acidiferrobacterales bacterium]